MIFATGPEITPEHRCLPVEDAAARAIVATAGGTLDDLERQSILAAPERCGGNRTAAAAALGIDRTTLYRKLEKYKAP